MDPVSNWINQFPVLAVMMGIMLFLLYWAIHVAVAIWMHRDGKQRNNPNITWWVFAFIAAGIVGIGTLSIIVVVLYAFVRARYPVGGEEVRYASEPAEHGHDYATPGGSAHVRVQRVSRDAALLLMIGPDTGERLNLNVPITTIGRGRENTISFPGDEGVSTRHCRIERDGDLYILEDFQSLNGTTVDRQGDVAKLAPRQRFRLIDGDVIRLGQTRMKFTSLRR